MALVQLMSPWTPKIIAAKHCKIQKSAINIQQFHSSLVDAKNIFQFYINDRGTILCPMFSQTMSLFKNEYYRCILYSKKLLIQFPCYNLNIHSQNRTCFLQSENFPYTHKTHKHVNILQCHICNLTSVDREAHFTYFTQDAHHMTTALPGQRTCLIKNTHTHAFPK